MFFDNLPEVPMDPIFGLRKTFNEDIRKNKVFLSVGIFQTEDLKTEVMECIKKAQDSFAKESFPANYLPFDGEAEFLEEISKVVFGDEYYSSNKKDIALCQTIGGTSALRLGAEAIFQHVAKKIYVSDPTWENHYGVFEKVGLEVASLPYYSKLTKSFDFASFSAALEKLPAGSVVLLHGCCHNPTGCDPTLEEWKKISKILKDKKILPFFDFAYQGFGKDLNDDAAAIRYFAKEGHEMLIAYSCSKNFSLYRQRVGAIFVVSKNNSAEKLNAHIKRSIRVNYSNPPSFGAKLVIKVLKDPVLKSLWLSELSNIRKRIIQMKEEFSKRLSHASKKDFSFLAKQNGMFSLTGLDKKQVERLREEFAIYMLSSGRINVAGLTHNNLDYVVNSICKVL